MLFLLSKSFPSFYLLSNNCLLCSLFNVQYRERLKADLRFKILLRQFNESKERQQQIIHDIAQVERKLSEQAEEISSRRERENVELKEKLDQLLTAQKETDKVLGTLTARIDKERDDRVAPATTGRHLPPRQIDFEVSVDSRGGDSSYSSIEINHRNESSITRESLSTRRRPLTVRSGDRESLLPRSRPSTSAHRRLSTQMPSQAAALDEENISPLKNAMRQTPKKQDMSKKNVQMMNDAKEVISAARLKDKKAKAHWPQATDNNGGRLTRSRLRRG